MTTEQGTETKTAKKVSRLVDTELILTHNVTYYRWDTDESYSQRLKEWAEELEEFIRDHRSQDRISIEVHRKMEDQCDQCGKPWEPDTQDGVTGCAYCGVTIESGEA
jgi:protein-arginine kinase activator protein McsA